MQQVRLILICGLPGSGKTTLAKQLAVDARAVRLSPDEWKHALAIDYYDDEARVRLEDRLWRLAQELLTLGQSVVMEHGFWAREERDELRLTGRTLGASVELYYLDASVEELWRRIESRNRQAVPGSVPINRVDLERWASRFEPPDADELALFDAVAPTPTEVVQQFVDAFVSAWPTGDASPVAAFFAEDASYHNGPLEPVHGRAAIESALAGFMAMGGEVAVDMVHVLANDRVVMTERVDHFVLEGKTFSLPVMGIFEIDNGEIRAWRDYFDLGQFSSLLTNEP